MEQLPNGSKKILVICARGFRARAMAEKVTEELTYKGYSFTQNTSDGTPLQGIRAVACFPHFQSWGRILAVVAANLAEEPPRQIALVGFVFVERWMFRLWLLFQGQTVKPTWLGFFRAHGSWSHPMQERCRTIIQFLGRRP